MIQQTFTCELLDRRRLSAGSFELSLSRPRHFAFRAGQRIRFLDGQQERDYSLASAPSDSTLLLCVRLIAEGHFSNYLHSTTIGSPLNFTGPHGHFVYRPSARPAVFVATGTGVAPFVSMAQSGIRGFILLHGIRSPQELLYADMFQALAKTYVPCISGKPEPVAPFHHGRVTDYLHDALPSGAYDFYLCGRNEMVRDAIWLIDERFTESRVYTEVFF